MLSKQFSVYVSTTYFKSLKFKEFQIDSLYVYVVKIEKLNLFDKRLIKHIHFNKFARTN